MNYFVETVYQAEDIKGFYDAFFYSRRAVRTFTKISRVLGVFLAGLCFLLAILMGSSAVSAFAQDGDGEVGGILAGATLFFLGMGWFFLQSRGGPVGRARAWKSYQHKGETLRYRFDVYHFTQESKGVRSELDYFVLQSIYEDRDRYYLFDSPRTAHILPKRDFQQGTPEAFREFISHTAGKPVIKIR
ncbi:YcxB family protein [Oscillibacter sp.]|uniref:YcxB family protein n=1 Tax=Oscillibacter sp. TaxID=1945593 RepID=UPI00262BB7C6|nr:YcxB family protein [Oscillibacter sp.]MDD3347554.1 YcxB family protein [Oscillibacter sp.]